MPESDVRHCTVEDTGMTVAGEGAAPFVEALNEYLKMFAATRDKDGYMHCHNCGENLDGLLGSFRWGMAHGEGFCSNCKWPAVGLHYPEKDGEKMFNRAWKVCLSVHPDYVSWGGGRGR